MRSCRMWGCPREQIRKFIRAQVLMVFFLPLVVAGIHSAFAFPIVSRLLSVLAMGDVKSFIYCLIGTFAGFAALYIIILLRDGQNVLQNRQPLTEEKPPAFCVCQTPGRTEKAA